MTQKYYDKSLFPTFCGTLFCIGSILENGNDTFTVISYFPGKDKVTMAHLRETVLDAPALNDELGDRIQKELRDKLKKVMVPLRLDATIFHNDCELRARVAEVDVLNGDKKLCYEVQIIEGNYKGFTYRKVIE